MEQNEDGRDGLENEQQIQDRHLEKVVANNVNCESGCAYHGMTDFVTNTLMKVQHVVVSENSVHNSCVPRTVIWTWRFGLSRQT